MRLTARKLLWGAATRLRLLARRQLPAWRRFRAADAARPAPAVTTGRRLLLLTWEFPPQVTGGVYRPLSFVRHAAASGWQAEVVCGPAPDLPSEAGHHLAGLLPADVPVTRVGADTGPHPWPLPKLDGGILHALSLFEAAATRIRPGQGGVILASGPPFASFVAGYWLARHTGWKLVLDYRDEWTENPHGVVRCDRTNRKWETRCQARADVVLFTTRAQLEHQVATFPELERSKCEIVYNGWESSDFESMADLPAGALTSRDLMALTFVGNLGPWWEIETFLADAVEALKIQPELTRRLQIRFVGRINPAVAAAIKRFSPPLSIVTTGELPKPAALREMLEADALLLPNPPRLARYIAGKTYEYVAAGRPILVHGTGGEIQRIVDPLGMAVVVAQRAPGLLAEALTRTLASVGRDDDKSRHWLTERTRESSARHLYELLDRMTMV